MTSTRPRHAKSLLERRLPERRYLPELHGIRGLALTGVVLFHLFGAGRTSGGIDIFLAVSGFLFTGMLLREAAANNSRIDPLKYYGRLVRRILAPAVIVITATLATGLLISPITKHGQLWTEARASLLYFENIELINSQLAYGAAGPETSPFQHFWSLSVQGQFYIVWPALAIIAVFLAKHFRTSAARVMAILIGVVFIASFVYAIWVGSYNQDAAYLMTTTRAWQLAFGGLLALAGGTIWLPKPLRAPAGWLGLALVVSCGFVLDGAALFPGPWALWPLAGLTLIMASAGPQGGNNDPTGTATHFLSNKPLAWIGDHAYSLYLWHWPLLIYYMEFRDRDAVGWRGAFLILAITVVLAILTNKYVERPLQHAPKTASQKPRNARTVVIGASILTIGAIATTSLSPSLPDLDATYEGLDATQYPGATQAFMDQPPPTTAPFPALENAEHYQPEYTTRGCQQNGGQSPGTDEILVCDDENAPEEPSATIVLAGGSHAGHLEAAFKTLGQKYGWEVLIITKPSCVFGWEERPDEERCGEWNENFVNWLPEQDVDLVVTPSTRIPNGDGPEYILDQAPVWWDRIAQTGTDLALVRGMPRQVDDAPDCLASGGTAQECGPSKKGYQPTDPTTSENLANNVHPIDVVPYVCPQIHNDAVDNCDAIVGNILVSYDNHHFTTPFSQSLAPAFEQEFKNTLPHLVR